MPYSVKKLIKNILPFSRDLYLLCCAPKEYIYSFTYPTNQYVKIAPYNPALKKFGDQLVQKIKYKYPHLVVYFHGSVAYKIAGEQDIDILVEASMETFSSYTPWLTEFFGKPVKNRGSFIEWVTKINGIDIEVLLIDPSHALAKKIVKTYLALKKDKKLLQAYEQFKLTAKDLSIREYTREKLNFFVYHNL